jgi:hypothetical protein
MSELSELKQGAFKNEGTQYHSYDTEKLDHEYFVDGIIHRIEKLLGTSALGSYIANHSEEHIQNVLNVLNRKNGGISKPMSTEDLHQLKEDARVIGQTIHEYHFHA